MNYNTLCLFTLIGTLVQQAQTLLMSGNSLSAFCFLFFLFEQKYYLPQLLSNLKDLYFSFGKHDHVGFKFYSLERCS